MTARTETDKAIQEGIQSHNMQTQRRERDTKVAREITDSQSNEVLCRSVRVKHVIHIHLVL
jgi:hypothetical protein